MIRLALIDSFFKSKIANFIPAFFYSFIFIHSTYALEKAPPGTFEHKQNIPVYANDKKIGYLNESLNDISFLNRSDNFFILETFNVFSKTVTIKSNAGITETGDKNNTSYFFSRDFDVTLDQKDDYAIISIRNTIGVSFYEIFIRKNTQNKLEIFKETGWDSVFVSIEIGEDNFDSQRADLICLREEVKIINDIIYVPDSLNLNEENKKSCYTKIFVEYQ